MSTENQEQGQTAKDLSYLAQNPFPTTWGIKTEHMLVVPGKKNRVRAVRSEYPSGLISWRFKVGSPLYWVPAFGWMSRYYTQNLSRALRLEGVLQKDTPIHHAADDEMKIIHDLKGPMLGDNGRLFLENVKLNSKPLEALLHLTERYSEDRKEYWGYSSYKEHIRVQTLGPDNRYVLIEGTCGHTAAFYVQDLGFPTESFCWGLSREKLKKDLKKTKDNTLSVADFCNEADWFEETLAEKLNKYKKCSTEKHHFIHPEYYGALDIAQKIITGGLQIMQCQSVDSTAPNGIMYTIGGAQGVIYGVIMGNKGITYDGDLDSLFPQPDK